MKKATIKLLISLGFLTTASTVAGVALSQLGIFDDDSDGDSTIILDKLTEEELRTGKISVEREAREERHLQSTDGDRYYQSKFDYLTFLSKIRVLASEKKEMIRVAIQAVENDLLFLGILPNDIDYVNKEQVIDYVFENYTKKTLKRLKPLTDRANDDSTTNDPLEEEVKSFMKNILLTPPLAHSEPVLTAGSWNLRTIDEIEEMYMQANTLIVISQTKIDYTDSQSNIAKQVIAKHRQKDGELWSEIVNHIGNLTYDETRKLATSMKALPKFDYEGSEKMEIEDLKAKLVSYHLEQYNWIISSLQNSPDISSLENLNVFLRLFISTFQAQNILDPDEVERVLEKNNVLETFAFFKKAILLEMVWKIESATNKNNEDSINLEKALIYTPNGEQIVRLIPIN